MKILFGLFARLFGPALPAPVVNKDGDDDEDGLGYYEPPWNRLSYAELAQIAKDMGDRGEIVDIETPHGTLSVIRHPLFDSKNFPAKD